MGGLFFLSRLNMKKIEFALTKGDYIQLSQLIKAVNIAANGAEAGVMVDDGIVKLNGAVESRKRAKIRVGDVVEILDYTIYVE
ncbi:ribosome-associated protein [Acetobacteroides hydrogenigenes]|uniref:Ribosome-associated protein n=2 Tax=Acetobacteroides hydrogenigenes TaxID=979970 RepID=A0A4R2ESR2_9BACT|nr:ribosome-associated protein [Acetobacteroides hydrogenigenes]